MTKEDFESLKPGDIVMSKDLVGVLPSCAKAQEREVTEWMEEFERVWLLANVNVRHGNFIEKGKYKSRYQFGWVLSELDYIVRRAEGEAVNPNAGKRGTGSEWSNGPNGETMGPSGLGWL